MKSLYESILSSNGAGMPEWMKHIKWSKSDIKNFIMCNLYNHMNFKTYHNEDIVVDDFIILKAYTIEEYNDDLNNNRKDKTFTYEIYATNAENINICHNQKKTFNRMVDLPTAYPKHKRGVLKKYILFSVRCGAYDEESANNIWLKHYKPLKDGQWKIRVYKNDYDKLPQFISTYNTNFDGHIPSSQLKRTIYT